MGNHFEVDPTQLDRLAELFHREAAELARATSGFDHAVMHVDQAFGLLGPSDDLYHQYTGLARECATGLVQLQRSLEGATGGLAATARNYRQADAGSTLAGDEG